MVEHVWHGYLQAMRAHLSFNERLAERIAMIVGDPPAAPRTFREQDIGTWRALLDESEQIARAHHQALLEYLKTL